MKNLSKKGIEYKLSQNELNLICDKYSLKKDENYYYFHELSKRYGCTQKLVDFLTELLFNNPNIGIELREEQKDKKIKLTPGAKDS